MIERPPRLELSADGRMGLIDDRQGHLQLYTLPYGVLILSLETDPLVTITCLSNSGAVVATLSERRLVEITAAGATTVQAELPGNLGQVRQMRVADDGQSLLFLVAGESGADWRLELWSLPFGSAPEASRDILAPERPRLAANGDLDRLAFWDDSQDGRASLNAFSPGEEQFRPLWEKETRPVAARLNYDWTWLVLESGLRGWRRDGRQARFSGTLRDRLIYSSQDQLLAYGGVVADAPLGPNETMMRFRLLDMENEREIGRLDRPVESSALVRFVVSDELKLYAVRVGEDGGLTVAPLGAFEGTA